MKTFVRSAALLLVVALGACAGSAPPFASVAGALAPVPPGQARLFVYRWLEPYETVAPSVAYLNGRAIGVTETGAVLYRDVAPGRYTISVESTGTYPDQFKTVVLAAGDVSYVRVESLRSWSGCGGAGESGGGGQACSETFVVRIVDPASARSELHDLRLIPG
jgi:hypothetical protein